MKLTKLTAALLISASLLSGCSMFESKDKHSCDAQRLEEIKQKTVEEIKENLSSKKPICDSKYGCF